MICRSFWALVKQGETWGVKVKLAKISHAKLRSSSQIQKLSATLLRVAFMSDASNQNPVKHQTLNIQTKTTWLATLIIKTQPKSKLKWTIQKIQNKNRRSKFYATILLQPSGFAATFFLIPPTYVNAIKKNSSKTH